MLLLLVRGTPAFFGGAGRLLRCRPSFLARSLAAVCALKHSKQEQPEGCRLPALISCPVCITIVVLPTT